MGFAERTLKIFLKALRTETLTAGHLKKIQKYPVETKDIEPYLVSEDYYVRRASFLAVSKWSKIHDELFERMLVEEDPSILVGAMKNLGKRDIDLEPLAELLVSENQTVKDGAIQMFKNAGQSEQMFTLLFDDDDSTANRVKRYMDNEG